MPQFAAVCVCGWAASVDQPLGLIHCSRSRVSHEGQPASLQPGVPGADLGNGHSPVPRSHTSASQPGWTQAVHFPGAERTGRSPPAWAELLPNSGPPGSQGRHGQMDQPGHPLPCWIRHSQCRDETFLSAAWPPQAPLDAMTVGHPGPLFLDTVGFTQPGAEKGRAYRVCTPCAPSRA